MVSKNNEHIVIQKVFESFCIEICIRSSRILQKKFQLHIFATFAQSDRGPSYGHTIFWIFYLKTDCTLINVIWIVFSIIEWIVCGPSEQSLVSWLYPRMWIMICRRHSLTGPFWTVACLLLSSPFPFSTLLLEESAAESLDDLTGSPFVFLPFTDVSSDLVCFVELGPIYRKYLQLKLGLS